MIPRGALFLAIASAAFAAPGAIAQVEPLSPVHLTVNGVFYLCPKLVRAGTAPEPAELGKLGFSATESMRAGELWFKGAGEQGALFVSYNPGNRQCTLDYAGAGYAPIAGIARDTVVKNRFVRITGGDRDGAKGDVYEGKVPDSTVTARIIVIENYTSSTTSIAYSERTRS